MTPRIIVCTADNAVWHALTRALSDQKQPLRLERVDRLEDATRHNATGRVAAAVVDDRFLPVLIEVEHALRRFSTLFHDTIVMTAGEALAAQWIGLLSGDLPSPPLLAWVARERTATRPTAVWQ